MHASGECLEMNSHIGRQPHRALAPSTMLNNIQWFHLAHECVVSVQGLVRSRFACRMYSRATKTQSEHASRGPLLLSRKSSLRVQGEQGFADQALCGRMLDEARPQVRLRAALAQLDTRTRRGGHQMQGQHCGRRSLATANDHVSKALRDHNAAAQSANGELGMQDLRQGPVASELQSFAMKCPLCLIALSSTGGQQSCSCTRATHCTSGPEAAEQRRKAHNSAHNLPE
jgi:hypothetical protein